MTSIGTLRESDLHAALKRHYARPGDQLETVIDGYVIDIVREDAVQGIELIEIQTHNFAALKREAPGLARQLEDAVHRRRQEIGGAA